MLPGSCCCGKLLLERSACRRGARGPHRAPLLGRQRAAVAASASPVAAVPGQPGFRPLSRPRRSCRQLGNGVQLAPAWSGAGSWARTVWTCNSVHGLELRLVCWDFVILGGFEGEGMLLFFRAQHGFVRAKQPVQCSRFWRSFVRGCCRVQGRAHRVRGGGALASRGRGFVGEGRLAAGRREGISMTHGAEFSGGPAECSAARPGCTGVRGISRQIPGGVFGLLSSPTFQRVRDGGLGPHCAPGYWFLSPAPSRCLGGGAIPGV